MNNQEKKIKKLEIEFDYYKSFTFVMLIVSIPLGIAANLLEGNAKIWIAFAFILASIIFLCLASRLTKRYNDLIAELE